MLLGQSPFKGSDEDEIFKAILQDEVVFPLHIHVINILDQQHDAVALLKLLLAKDPHRRLGSGYDDAAPIKRQPYFSQVNWDDIFHLRVKPPFFPR